MSMKSDLKEKLSQIRSRPIQVTVDGPVSKKYVEVSKATVDSTANKVISFRVIKFGLHTTMMMACLVSTHLFRKLSP